MNELEKVRQEIKVLEAKLSLLEEIEKHNVKSKMTLEISGKFEIVSYNGEVYYRLEYPTNVVWCKQRYKCASDEMMLIAIIDLETHRLLEGVWFNDVKKGKYDEPYCPDEPGYDEIEHDISANVENKTIRDVIDRWWIDTFTSKNMWSVNECIDDLADQVEFWILRNKNN